MKRSHGTRVLLFTVAVLILFVGIALGIASAALRPVSVIVRFAAPEQDLGAVCAASDVIQNNSMLVDGPATVQVTATIFNAATGEAYTPLSQNHSLAIPAEPAPAVIKDIFHWQAPDLPPASYIRVVGAATFRYGLTAAQTTRFSIRDCRPGSKP